MEFDEEILIDAWKKLSVSESEIREKDPNFWAYETFDYLSEEKPFRCVEVIFKVCETTNDERVLANLAAGPLEDLLVRHGKAVIQLFENWAEKDAKNRRVLAFVWKNNIDEDVWARVKKATGTADSF